MPVLVWMAVGIAALIAVPILSVAVNLFLGGTSDTWSHLASTVLPAYIANTLWLCVGVTIGVILVGVSTAWVLGARTSFPGGGSSSGRWCCPSPCRRT